MRKKTSILLGRHFDEFINNEVSSGRYNAAREVIRTALRLLEATQKGKEIEQALTIGEQSGFIENFNPKKNLKSLHKKFL